jgi:hypothetical protein
MGKTTIIATVRRSRRSSRNSLEIIAHTVDHLNSTVIESLSRETLQTLTSRRQPFPVTRGSADGEKLKVGLGQGSRVRQRDVVTGRGDNGVRLQCAPSALRLFAMRPADVCLIRVIAPEIPDARPRPVRLVGKFRTRC